MSQKAVQESPERKPHHAERVTGWYHVNPDSMRMMEIRHPDTGQTFTGVFISITDPGTGNSSVWLSNRHGWSRAEKWMASAYLEKLRQESEA